MVAGNLTRDFLNFYRLDSPSRVDVVCVERIVVKKVEATTNVINTTVENALVVT